jgi:hypothetical protein
MSLRGVFVLGDGMYMTDGGVPNDEPLPESQEGQLHGLLFVARTTERRDSNVVRVVHADGTTCDGRLTDTVLLGSGARTGHDELPRVRSAQRRQWRYRWGLTIAGCPASESALLIIVRPTSGAVAGDLDGDGVAERIEVDGETVRVIQNDAVVWSGERRIETTTGVTAPPPVRTYIGGM